MALRFVVHAMSLPKYAEYKDSGVAWIGEVPAHWVPYKVREFTQFCGGGTPSRDNLAFWNGDIPWVSPKDMKFARIKGAEECITDEGLLSSSSSLVDPGRLLIVVRSGILKHTIPVAINDVQVALNQDMKALRFSEKLATSEFFLRWVQGLNDVLLLAWAKQGATVESIEHAYLAGTIVPLPTLPEQSAIAAFLDRETGKIDALIAEQEKLLTLLAEKRQATISHAVTRGLNANAPRKDSGIAWLGYVPAHWAVRSLKSIVSTPITDGPHETPQFLDEGVPFVSAEAVSGGTINFEKIRAYISLEDDERYSKKYRPEIHDIYMVKSGATTGVTAMVEGRTDFNIWSPLAAIRCNAATIEPVFALHYLRSKNFQEGVALNWSFGTQQNIGMGVLGDLPIPVPPVSEQREIMLSIQTRLDGLAALQIAAEDAIPLLKERRSALIAAAVTGKIDVRQAA